MFSNLKLVNFNTIMIEENKRLIIIETIAASILLIPLVAMQFTSEVNWTLGDFVVGAVLLLGTGAVIDLALRIVKKKTHRVAVASGILLVLVLVWTELAVGIFGSFLAGS